MCQLRGWFNGYGHISILRIISFRAGISATVYMFAVVWWIWLGVLYDESVRSIVDDCRGMEQSYSSCLSAGLTFGDWEGLIAVASSCVS